MFRIEGENIDVHLENLIINGIHADSDFVGNYSGATILAEYGERNKIVVNNCVMSHFQHVALWNFGQSTDFHITNSVFKDQLSYPGGMFFGGVLINERSLIPENAICRVLGIGVADRVST